MTLAIIAMVMVSCMIVEEKDASEVDTSVELVFEATLGSDDYTKSSVQSDESSVWWSAHERINLFFADSESSLFTSTNDAPSAKVQFRGTIEAFTGQVDGSDAGYFWGIYPYDASNTSNGTDVIATLSPEQVACPGTFADNQWLAVAHSQGLSLSFRAVCAGFRFYVTKEGVKSVTFKGNNNEILAGKARIGVDENNLPVVLENLSEEREITLSAPEGEALEVGTLYYMTFFPNNFTKGFTVTFNTETESGTRIYNSPKDFKRTDVHRGVAFDKGIEYTPFCSDYISFTDSEVKRICVEVAGWDTNGDGEISFDEAAEVKSLMKSSTYSFFYKTSIRSFDELQFFTGLTSIEFNAFYQCESLGSITLPSSVISISGQAFMRCYNLDSITLPSNIEVIDRYAFSESGLNSIIIPGRVTTIGYGAFEMMDNLKEIKVEAVNCPSGSEGMFYDTNNCPIIVPAESIDAYINAPYWSEYANRIKPSNVIIFADEYLKYKLVEAFDSNDDGELSFTEAASVTDCRKFKSAFNEETSFSSFDEFQYFTGLSNLSIKGMFKGWSITSIILPNSITEMSGEYIFTDCKNLSSVVLSEGLKTIGYNAFQGCTQLSSVRIPESVTTIKSTAFSGSGLTSITIPNTISSIEDNVFNSCTNLSTISLPENLLSIGFRSFYHCESLRSIIIGEAITFVGQESFLGCNSLESIFVRSSNPPIGQSDMFKGTHSCPIYIPAGSGNAYLSAMYWKDYSLRLNDGAGFLGYFSSDYSKDGEVVQLQKATVGKGINIILMGDGFLDKDMEEGGLYDQTMYQAMEQFFAYEPYTTFRDRFNIYAVKVISSNSEFTEDADRRLTYHEGESIYMRTEVSTQYAKLVPNPNNQPIKIAVLENTDHRVARSWCFWDSSGWSCCFVFAPGAVLNHELGGHGFANLYDEYVEKNESFSSFEVLDNDYNNYGFGANVDWHNTISNIRWSRLMNDSRYSEEGLGIIEGGYLYARGIYRATENSMMRYNDSPFNAPSREQIYKRIMRYSEGDDWQYDYETFVSFDEAGRKQAAEAFSTKVNSTSVRKSSSHEKRDLPPLQIDSGVKSVGVDDKGNIEIVR